MFNLPLIQFIKDNNIYVFILTGLLSNRFIDLTNSMIDGLIMPFISEEVDKDKYKLNEYTVKIFNTNVQIGQVAVGLIKFIALYFIIALFAKMF